jgi:predicted regulator of Ras-like GTPase activity (Roadblock/LC7/MglB family)
VVQKTGSARDLAWLLDDLVERVAHAERGIVLSNDGLLIASSHNLSREEAEHLAAAAAGFQSLARGTGRYIGGGTVRQTIVELEKAFFFVTAAGKGACLAVQASAEADVGLIAYEMNRLVSSVGKFLSTPLRSQPATAAPTVEA